MRFLLLFFCLFALATTTLACINASCKPMDVNGYPTGCSGNAGYVWTGTSCIYRQVCNCTGRDCQSIYSTQEACENAHIHCRR
jgi:hypothetical protein